MIMIEEENKNDSLLSEEKEEKDKEKDKQSSDVKVSGEESP